MTGTYNAENNKISLEGKEWLVHPSGYNYVNINGTLDDDGMIIEGSTSSWSGLYIVKD